MASIKGLALAKQANMIWMRGINETCELLSVHVLGKDTIEEGVGDVELIDKPISVSSTMKHRSNICRFENRTKVLVFDRLINSP